MSFTKESAVYAAIDDLAKRLGVDEGDVKVTQICDKEFPDAALGAPVEGEISASVICEGWEIELSVEDAAYLYRADAQQLRACGGAGKNHIVG